jgi:hypothetical protein
LTLLKAGYRRVMRGMNEKHRRFLKKEDVRTNNVN